MMSRKPSRLLALVLLTALCCLLLAPCALAFERVDLTHPLTFAIQADDNEDDAHLPGVTFQLYQVADMDADARFALRSPYSTLNIDINALKNAADWAAASEAKKALTASETPDFTGTTDENGRVAFAGLNPGLYLVSGTPVIIGGWAYSFQSFLTSVPTRNVDDEWQYDVLSTIKLERSPALIDLECVKEWDDDNRGTYRPVQIEIHLMQDGQHIDTVILNSENNWHHIFKDLPADHVYTLNEILGADVYYEPEYSIENGVYVITNRRTVTPTPTAPIPETGQLWWPVPILAGAGMILFVIGWILHRKWSQEHEEP